MTSTITKCQMLVWPELIFSDPPVSHLGDVFFATFSPSKNPPHLTSGRLFLQLFCSLESAHLTSVWLRLRLLAPLVRQFCGEAWKGETASNGSTTKSDQVVHKIHFVSLNQFKLKGQSSVLYLLLIDRVLQVRTTTTGCWCLQWIKRKRTKRVEVVRTISILCKHLQYSSRGLAQPQLFWNFSILWISASVFYSV